MLATHALEYAYTGKPVLRGMDAAFAYGRMTAVVGPNGSGKSTLIKLLCGALRPQRGSVTLDGREVYRIGARERARLMALLPQSTHVAFDFTVRDVVMMGRHAYVPRFGSESAQDYMAVKQAMHAAQVEDLAASLVTQLSGGEAQRVFAARALAQQARVYLLDEPVSNLDIRHQMALLRLFYDMARQGACVVCVLHDLNMAARFADDVLLMQHGRSVCFGAPGDVLRSDLLSRVYAQPLARVDTPQGQMIVPV